jgi:hypothetical protein
VTAARIEVREVPPGALLHEYVRRGDYADCFALWIPRRVTHAEYVAAFYTTGLFKLERLVLAVIGKPSTDAAAADLAAGARNDFAAWSVEGRAPDQILMCDFRGDTRSWLMVEPGGDGTRLYFGSAVVKRRIAPSGAKELTGGFRALLGFHTAYSRALLAAAHRRLSRARSSNIAA